MSAIQKKGKKIAIQQFVAQWYAVKLPGKSTTGDDALAKLQKKALDTFYSTRDGVVFKT